MGTSADDAALVLAVRGGDQAAFGELFARWSDRCYDVARRIVHDDGIAAEVAQDVFLAAWQQLDALRDPSAFGGWVLRTARNRALNRLEKERRSVSTADDAPVLSLVASGDAPDQDVEAAMTALDHRELLDAATVALGEREASVLDLHLRHGLSAAELAEELGVTTNNAHQLIFRTKKKLAAGIRAWVLVRGGRPSCAALAVALDDAGMHEFSRAAIGVIGDHADGCDECAGRQASVLDPAALFAAAPIVALAPALRATVVDGLRAAGVPIGGGGPAPAADAPTGAGGGAESASEGPGGPGRPDGPDGPTGPSDGGGPPIVPDAAAGPADEDPRRRRLVALVAAVLLLLGGGALMGLRTDGETEPVASGPATTDSTTTSGGEGEPRSGTSTTVDALPAPEGSTSTSTPGLVLGTTAPDAAPSTSTPGEAQPTASTAPPAQPTTTAPPTVPTTTTRPATPSTTTTTRPPAPVVRRFAATLATSPGGDCPPARWATTLWWTVEGATSVTIEASGVTPLTGLATSGRRTVCRFTPGAPPGGWKLTATGPGGTATATA